MARPRKSDALDLSSPIDFTAGAIERLICPPGKTQAFLRDTKSPGLRVRVTAAGAKSYVFEAKLHGQTIRRTIGDVRAWTIEKARSESNSLRVLIDDGTDPRELERRKATEKANIVAAAAARSITVGAVWPLYLERGRPKRRDSWKPRYRADLVKMAAPGGVKKSRGQGVTRPGPLFPLLSLPLVSVDEDALKSWYDREAVAGEHQAARALMMFRGFLRWCSGQPEYRSLIDRDAGKAAAIIESLPANVRRTDTLESAQVVGWWSGVMQLSNSTASTYLRALLLTGARREEMASLKWADVDFRWGKLTLADKVDATRTIPLTPYIAEMLAALPRHNEWVFSSTRILKMDVSNIRRRELDNAARGNPAPVGNVSDVGTSGRMTDPRSSHAKALRSAGIEGLTIHGLRRSFSVLGEAAGAPAGAIAQVMGHKPSATAEGYRYRSIDELRRYLERIEKFILRKAGVVFKAKHAVPGALSIASAA